MLVVIVAFSGLVFIGWEGLGQAYNLATELPEYRQNITTKLRTVNFRCLGRLGKTKQMLGKVTGELVAQDQAQKSLVKDGRGIRSFLWSTCHSGTGARAGAHSFIVE